MTPERVAEILLVQAAEEVQPTALPPEARIDALEAAGDLDDERAWFARRAAYLLGHPLAGVRPLLRVRDALAPGVGWNLALPGLLGLASSALGPHEQIHVLYNPIVGLVAWSLAVYLGLAVLALRPQRPARLNVGGLRVPELSLPRSEGGFLARALRRGAARLWLRALRSSATAREQASAFVKVGTRFFELWERAARPWFALRTSRICALPSVAA